MAIGIPMDTIGSGIKAIGLGHRIWARVGGLLVMSAGNTLTVIGKEIAAGSGMTITGTVIEAGTFVRKTGIGSTIAGSSLLRSFSGKRRISDEKDSYARVWSEFCTHVHRGGGSSVRRIGFDNLWRRRASRAVNAAECLSNRDNNQQSGPQNVWCIRDSIRPRKDDRWTDYKDLESVAEFLSIRIWGCIQLWGVSPLIASPDSRRIGLRGGGVQGPRGFNDARTCASR